MTHGGDPSGEGQPDVWLSVSPSPGAEEEAALVAALAVVLAKLERTARPPSSSGPTAWARAGRWAALRGGRTETGRTWRQTEAEG